MRRTHTDGHPFELSFALDSFLKRLPKLEQHILMASSLFFVWFHFIWQSHLSLSSRRETVKVIDFHCELRFGDIPCSFFREVSNDISRHALSIRKRRIFNLERDCILDRASHFLFLFLLCFLLSWYYCYGCMYTANTMVRDSYLVCNLRELRFSI